MGVQGLCMKLLSSASPAGMKSDDWKPIIRCTIAAWAGLLLILIPQTLNVLGQASFLVMVIGMANPPSGPIVKVCDDAMHNMLYACCSWAWFVVASRCATAVRTNVYTSASLNIPGVTGVNCASTPASCFSNAIFDGEFIEARPSIIFAFFLYIGISVFLYIKVTQPGRVFSVIFGCISMIIPLVYGPLFPYYYPTLGEVIAIPIACQCAINVVCSVLFWPQSMNHAYTKQIQGLIATLSKLTQTQSEVLRANPRNAEIWDGFASIKDQIRAARMGLSAFGPNEALLIREFQYGRLGADELRALTTRCRDVVLKMGGFSLFYDLVTQHLKSSQDKLDSGLPMSARPSTDRGSDRNAREKSRSNLATPGPSGQATPDRHLATDSSDSLTRDQASILDQVSEKLTRKTDHSKKHAHFKVRTPNLLHDALHHVYKPVGAFEMHDFAEHEKRFPKKIEVDYLLKMMELVSDSSQDIFECVVSALSADMSYLESMNKDRFFNRFLFRRKPIFCTEELESARHNLQHAIDAFKKEGRLKMLEPYESISGSPYATETPHRPLLRMFYLEFHLIRFAESTLKLTQKCIELDHTFQKPRWYVPRAFFFWEFTKDKSAQGQRKSDAEVDFANADEATLAENDEDLYQTEVRDPDCEPPSRWYHLVGQTLTRGARVLKNPSVFFALKSALLVVLIAFPCYLRRSAGWYYHERGLWAVIMAAFTSAPFTGDIVFIWIWRVVGTFFGAAIGCVLWYIGDGAGNGSPYGLAATMAVAFVLLMYVRLRWIYLTPQPALIFVITVALIVGYSWQDTHLPSAVNYGTGWNIAWRRFTVVLIGITAAFLWGFLPKPTTGRQVVRRRLAAGAFDVGNIYVSVSNFARNPHRTTADEEEIRQMVTKAGIKLLVINARLTFASYEPPISGPWPKDKYTRILQLQRELLDLMVSFVNNISNMDPAWVEPMLRRTGWHDRELVGDCLSVLFMASNAIKTGTALPQLVPAPITDRLYARMERIQSTQGAGSLPTTVSRETLEDPGYAGFAVGSVISFALVHRIDALLLVVKELVGEVWHTTHFVDHHDQLAKFLPSVV